MRICWYSHTDCLRIKYTMCRWSGHSLRRMQSTRLRRCMWYNFELCLSTFCISQRQQTRPPHSLDRMHRLEFARCYTPCKYLYRCIWCILSPVQSRQCTDCWSFCMRRWCTSRTGLWYRKCICHSCQPRRHQSRTVCQTARILCHRQCRHLDWCRLDSSYPA